MKLPPYRKHAYTTIPWKYTEKYYIIDGVLYMDVYDIFTYVILCYFGNIFVKFTQVEYSWRNIVYEILQENQILEGYWNV